MTEISEQIALLPPVEEADVTADDKAGWKRARRPEQKEERVKAILDAAAELFRAHAVAELTIGAIAERAGLAKGSIYRYFATKEEVLVTVLMRELTGWFEEIDRQLAVLGGGQTPEVILEILLQALARRELMVHLLARLANDLEHNLSLASALRLKEAIAVHLSQTGALLERALPSLQPGAGARFLMWLQVLLSGLWPMAHPVGAVCQVLERPAMQGLRVSFQPELERMAVLLLRGLMHGDRPDSSGGTTAG